MQVSDDTWVKVPDLSLAVDGHVGDAGLALQALLETLQLLWGHKELHICLLVYIPTHKHGIGLHLAPHMPTYIHGI